jgi:hypothetical protein
VRREGGLKGVLLWGRVLDELNTLLDVALKTSDASLQELLLLLGDATEDVDGLLGTVGLYIALAACWLLGFESMEGHLRRARRE